MSRVQYNSKRLIPAPFVNIKKSYTKTGDGRIIGKLYSITINGTIVSYMGSPTSSGTFWQSGGYPPDESVGNDSRLSAILRKQEAIRNLFSIEGKSFEVQALDATDPMKCNPRVIDIDFPDGEWYNTCPYTVTLETDELYPEQEDDFSSLYISDANEDWSIEESDEPEGYGLELSKTYRVTHSVNAVGKRFYDDTGSLVKEAWEQAREYVVPRLGFDSTIALASGVHNLPAYYQAYNYLRTNNISEDAGTYSSTETWVLASGNAKEEFDINVQNSVDSSLTKVDINGNIQGYEDSSDKWDNALTKFGTVQGLVYGRAQTFSGINSLNIKPLSYSIGKNPVTGSINYAYSYDNRPSNLVSGALSEVISINDNLRGDMFASIFVLGRQAGPVLQDLNAKTQASRSINIEIVVPVPTFSGNSVGDIINLFISQKPSINPTYSGDIINIVRAANPAYNGFLQVYSNQPQESWDARSGRWSWSQEWVYE